MVLFHKIKFLASHEITRVLHNLKFHYRFHNTLKRVLF